MSEYKGNSVLVTGAQQGIGRSMVLNFAKGADVAITGTMTNKKLSRLRKKLKPWALKSN